MGKHRIPLPIARHIVFSGGPPPDDLQVAGPNYCQSGFTATRCGNAAGSVGTGVGHVPGRRQAVDGRDPGSSAASLARRPSHSYRPVRGASHPKPLSRTTSTGRPWAAASGLMRAATKLPSTRRGRVAARSYCLSTQRRSRIFEPDIRTPIITISPIRMQSACILCRRAC